MAQESQTTPLTNKVFVLQRKALNIHRTYLQTVVKAVSLGVAENHCRFSCFPDPPPMLVMRPAAASPEEFEVAL